MTNEERQKVLLSGLESIVSFDCSSPHKVTLVLRMIEVPKFVHALMEQVMVAEQEHRRIQWHSMRDDW